MNMSIDLTKVAGKNIEDLTTEELCTIAWQAGNEAYLKAKKQGFRVTDLQNGHLILQNSLISLVCFSRLKLLALEFIPRRCLSM